MRRQPIEVYGFGTRLPTRSSRMGCVLLGAAVVGALVAMGVMPW